MFGEVILKLEVLLTTQLSAVQYEGQFKKAVLIYRNITTEKLVYFQSEGANALYVENYKDRLKVSSSVPSAAGAGVSAASLPALPCTDHPSHWVVLCGKHQQQVKVTWLLPLLSAWKELGKVA